DGIDIVIHAAAYISVSESMRKPLMYFKNNVLGTLNVVNSCIDKKVKLIFLSSASVYGEPLFLPISESHPTNPISTYALTKLMGEEIIKFYFKRGFVILRLFNVYGPGQSSTYAGVITKFIERIKNNKPPIIYGDGLQTRDFIHVYDVAQAIKLCIEKGIENEIINIATGRPISIRDLSELIIKLSGSSHKPIFTRPRAGDIKHSYADITKAERLLGFKPRISIEEGLKELLSS
ncbi:MAG: GDP-mannose 4,6-dehydratase, partial [Candidatus Methanomethyliaceae archaeon]|nr:GDP-mannose 4,6-dehydratase [Candidatus Methanomethyliaceae archaeon]